MIAGAVAAVAVLALPAWQMIAPAYRQAHGCAKVFGVWWGVPEFDSTLFCPWDINRMDDLGYVMRAMDITNYADALQVMKPPTAKPEPEQAAAFDTLLRALEKSH
jgi:hypothetical protein